MHTASHQIGNSFPVNIDSHGRVVLPATSQVRIAGKNGEPLVALETAEGDLLIRRYRDVVKEVQVYFREKVAGRNLVDELIAERRREAENE